jgi:MFS transporter, DHA1 family, multidrug resistance protein
VNAPVRPVPAASTAEARPGFREFVVLVAVMSGLTALSIDNLLPAFPAIQGSFSVADPNRLQLLVYVYMAGFALGQLVYGPVSDARGRRPTLVVGLAIYIAGCALAAAAQSFEVLIAARAVQGIGAAASRILSLAIVRDRFAGRDMARVMSLTMMVFLLVPIVAPAIGQASLLVASWRALFVGMLVLALLTGAWFFARMPETLHPEYRRPLSVGAVASAVARTATTRVTFGYATALSLLFGCLMGYVGSAEQVFDSGLYHLGGLFPLAFALVAGAMGLATLLNARLVRRIGMRRLSHAGILGCAIVTAAHLALALYYDGRPPVALFLLGIGLSQFLIAFALPNFNALAIEPLAAIAGTASSVIGSYTTILGAAAGLAVGQAFDGTVVPMTLGYATFSLAALLVVVWTERGRLFQVHNAPPPARSGTATGIAASR